MLQIITYEASKLGFDDILFVAFHLGIEPLVLRVTRLHFTNKDVLPKKKSDE